MRQHCTTHRRIGWPGPDIQKQLLAQACSFTTWGKQWGGESGVNQGSMSWTRSMAHATVLLANVKLIGLLTSYRLQNWTMEAICSWQKSYFGWVNNNKG
ncbi:MAG: hypothetical protein AAF741_14470 [Bacteroidota bacterium]